MENGNGAHEGHASERVGHHLAVHQAEAGVVPGILPVGVPYLGFSAENKAEYDQTEEGEELGESEHRLDDLPVLHAPRIDVG